MTVADAATRERLRAELPDIPRWMETRWMLGLKSTEVTGLGGVASPAGDTGADPISLLIGMILTVGEDRADAGGGFVVRDPPSGFISVVGKPAIEAIRAAVEANERPNDVVTQPENAEHVKSALPRWKQTRAKLHWLADSEKLFGPSGPRTDMLGLPERGDDDDGFGIDIAQPEFITNIELTAAKDLPDELRHELLLAALRGLVVGVKVVGHGHVSFCHAEVQTETLWDVSIDTLEDHRRKGYAEKAVTHLAEHMLDERNKRPVWGALETNEASLRLAAKLGFRPVDELVAFERD